MAKLRSSPTLDRSELEAAASAFFSQWIVELDQPRHPDQYNEADQISFNVECSRNRISELDQQLASNLFDGQVTGRARAILKETGRDFDELSADEQLFALKLSGRAEREYMRLFIHELSQPHKRFLAEDDLFDRSTVSASGPARRPVFESAISLREAVTLFLRRKTERRLSQSEVDETGRVLNWLCERMGGDRPVTSITKAELRSFRDDLCRLNVKLRGRGTRFAARLTDNADGQIKSVTADKYWRFVRSFFAWCADDGYVEQDQASGLRVEARKHVDVGSHERYMLEADVERQLTLESYGYKFLRINRFNLGRDPIATLSDRLGQLVDALYEEREVVAVERVQEIAGGLATKELKECSKCHSIRPTSEFFDPALKDGKGGTGRVCIPCKRTAPPPKRPRSYSGRRPYRGYRRRWR